MKTSKTNKGLQIASLIILFITVCPYLYLLLNIQPVYLYAQETGENALLKLYAPLCILGILGFASFLLFGISLFVKGTNELEDKE